MALTQIPSGMIAPAQTLSLNGITFPATAVPSADANTLDDYEEGTWTPTLRFSGDTTGITYGTRVGKYTKVGNFVFATGVIQLTNKGSVSGEATISGLPFPADETNRSYGGNGQVDTGGASLPQAIQCLAFGTLVYNRYGNSDNFLAINNTNFTNSTVYFFNVIYFAV
jgi:hypothetical protein